MTEKLPRLSLCEKLGSPACIVLLASDVLILLECRYCLSKQVWQGTTTEFLASAMMTFSLRSNIWYKIDTGTRGSSLVTSRLSQLASVRYFAPCDIECIYMTTFSGISSMELRELEHPLAQQ